MDIRQFRGLNTTNKEQVPSASAYINNTDVDWSLRHFFVLLIVGAGFGVFSSFLLLQFNAAPSFSTLFAATLGLCALLTVTVFQSLLLKSFQLFFWVTLAEVGGLLAFFYTSLTPWLVFGAIALVGYCISGFLRGRLDLTDHLKVHFGRFSKIVMSAGISGLAIFLAFFYVGIYRANGISFEAFQFVAAGSRPALNNFVPGYNDEVEAETFFEEFARQQLKSNPQFVLLLKADQERVVEQTGYQLRSQVVSATQTTVQPEETFEHYLYRIVLHYSEIFDSQQLQVLPVLIILFAIYSVIRGVMFLFKWPVIFVSYLVYRILLSIRLVYIATEPRSKEIIMTK